MLSLDVLLDRIPIEEFLINKRVYIVYGPTGTGKTSLAIELAKKIDAEIINCDMAQIYSEVKIGVGQIKEEEKDGVLHYLFGFLLEPSLFSVYQMRIEIENKIALILLKNKNVILVGGSSFCVYSLFFAPFLFYEKLNYNFVREEKEKTAVFSFSDEEKRKNDFIAFLPKYEYIVILIDFDFFKKDDWLNKIKKRIDDFINDGWVEEIIKMDRKWIDFLLKKKFIGYNELINFIENKYFLTFDEVKDLIFFRTCQYGKKQRTFLRKMKRDFSIYNVLYIENNF